MRLAIAVICLLACLVVYPMTTRDSRPVRVYNPMSELVRDATDARARQARVESQLLAGAYTYVELRSDAAEKLTA